MDRGQHDRTLIGRTRDAKKRTDGFMILYSRQGREFPAGCFFLKAGYDILDERIVIDRFFFRNSGPVYTKARKDAGGTAGR